MGPELRTPRPRWADLRDSSNETFAESQSNTAAPVADTLDSYRDPPDRELGENSQASLNKRFRQTGPSASSGQPRDFTFLLGASRAEASAAPAATAAAAPLPAHRRLLRTRHGGPPAGARAAAAAAREDDCESSQDGPGVPELAQSNLLRFCGSEPSDFSFLLDVKKRQEPLLEEEGSLGSESGEPTAPGDPSFTPSAAAAGAGGRRGRRTKRKRRQGAAAQTQEGCQKRPREGGDTQANEGGHQIMAPAGAAVAAAGAADELASGDGPERNAAEAQLCDEEVILHRLEKRATLIEIIKRSLEYQFFSKTRPSPDAAEEEVAAAPRTPDFTDRTISKRRWEEDVRHWRLDLRQWELKHAT